MTDVSVFHLGIYKQNQIFLFNAMSAIKAIFMAKIQLQKTNKQSQQKNNSPKKQAATLKKKVLILVFSTCDASCKNDCGSSESLTSSLQHDTSNHIHVISLLQVTG